MIELSLSLQTYSFGAYYLVSHTSYIVISTVLHVAHCSQCGQQDGGSAMDVTVSLALLGTPVSLQAVKQDSVWILIP